MTTPIRLLAGSVLALTLTLSGCSVIDERPEISEPSDSTEVVTSPGTDSRTVETTAVRVTDGDTIIVKPVEGGLKATNEGEDEHSVRILGIDTPELNLYKSDLPECGAQDAAAAMREKLPAGTEVILTFDPVSDETDRYGRSLAYVSTPQNDDLGRAQVADGWAEAWFPSSAPEPRRVSDYEQLADQAEAREAGAWGDCGSIGRD